MKKKIFRYLAMTFAILAIAWIGMALVPPPPANQNLGAYDTTVNQLVEQNCRNCHTSGVPDRHHNLVPTGEYQCLNCHPVITKPDGSQSILLDRNCIACHNGTGFYANPSLNPGKPHHNTTQATARNCKFCHGSYVDNYNDGHSIPIYNKSNVTPDTSYKVINASTGRKWGGCEACHEANLTVSPKIVANSDSHHNLGQVSINCNYCHPGGSALDIRTCETCHGVKSIHNIQYNYASTNGQLGYGHIGANWDCNGCHAWYVAGATYPSGAITPDISAITPAKLTAGVATVVTITGSNFLQDTYTTSVVVDGTALTPTSVTDNQIVVTVPALSAGVHNVQVAKGDAKSRLLVLTVVTPVDVTSAKLSGTITISGTGFGSQPDPLFKDLGVFITHKGTTFKAKVISWSDTKIVVSGAGANAGDLLTVKALNGQDSTTISGGGKKK